MSGKIALDTNVSIKFLNGDTNIDAILLKYSEICLPAIVVGELVFGALNSKHAEQNLARHSRYNGSYGEHLCENTIGPQKEGEADSGKRSLDCCDLH